MLTHVDAPQPVPDPLRLSLESSERLISQIRARQIAALRTLDTEQVATRDGSRSLEDWVAAHLDVDPDSARALVQASKLLLGHVPSEMALASGDISFDRAVATARLAASGADDDLLRRSAGRDIAGVRRLTSRRRYVTKTSEREAADEQYLALQPSLDRSVWRVWGQFAALPGQTLDRALTVRGDDLPDPVGTESRAQRNAHALVAIAQDSLDGGPVVEAPPSSAPIATVFIDADIADRSRGQAGSTLAAGPPVGPATLEQILCEGRVEVVASDQLHPIVASRTVRAIPPALRRFVLDRDGACVIDGCSSRYRLQPHHIQPFSQGGGHDAENLATLCWYHHHVAIHGSGFSLDPDSPPQRRRLRPPLQGPDPPALE